MNCDRPRRRSARGSSRRWRRRTCGWLSDCAIASAIWLRQALCSSTNRMRKVSAPGVLGVLAGAHVERLHADVARLVRDALEAAADRDQRLERLRLELLVPERVDDLGVELAEQRVHRRLDRDDVLRERRILPDERLDGVVEHRDRQVGHLDDPLEEAVGWPRHAAQPQELAGDALGVVADALQLQVDLDRAVGEPQVARPRAAAGPGTRGRAGRSPSPSRRCTGRAGSRRRRAGGCRRRGRARSRAASARRAPPSRAPARGFFRCRVRATVRGGWPWVSGGDDGASSLGRMISGAICRG